MQLSCIPEGPLKIILILTALLFGPALTFAQSNSLKSPNISADALFLYRQSNFSKEDFEDSSPRNGLDLQEAELAFYADVDPYSRLNLLLSVHPDYEYLAATHRIKQTWGVEPEELFVESGHVAGVTLRLGKFKAAFGKHGLLHTHAYPFVDAPLINSSLLGAEGLNDVGASAAVLIPLSWYSELTLQYLRGEGENYEFHSPTPGDGVGVGHWKNLWDLCDSTTVEVGASYARGNNDLGGVTTLSGGDLTFKWRPLSGGRYRSGILAFEYIDRAQQQLGAGTERGAGLSSWVQFQFAERWTAKLRYETLKVTGSDAGVNTEHSLANALSAKTTAALQFDATEFSFFRLEYERLHGPAQSNGLANENKIYLQANFTIGAHPAHSY